jgi:hypothetical protein
VGKSVMSNKVIAEILMIKIVAKALALQKELRV